MIILGIETSCDETSAAVVENGTNVLSHSIASSEKLHIKTGGIIPEKAAREQVKSIMPVIDEALKIAKLKIENLNAIAVTTGPGLIGSLLVGVETAKTLSFVHKKPLIPVNHLLAHFYANWIDNHSPPVFPALGLIVSGGHTDFALLESNNEVKWIGGTRDDAAGEAFDKTARILGLPYPGGPAISEAAEKTLNYKSKVPKLDLFPRPMVKSGDLDMSFSGLKTSVLNYIKKNPDKKTAETAAQIQEAIVDTLVAKSLKAVEIYNPKSFILSGGVSANKRLRLKLSDALRKYAKHILFYVPSPEYSTDNAVMIASCAFFRGGKQNWKKVRANPNLGVDESAV